MNTLVFAGPTLTGLSAWKASLADRYVFHPPVRCGNVLEAYREGYRRIVIVDGLFEQCPAVWHKEILYVLSKGGVVVGCSSMGALRAIECEPFGMLGFGEVVADFRAGRIADDDEVTVGHLDAERDFAPVSDAMVNIRHTVRDAVTRGVLDDDQATAVLRAAKAMFYKHRSLELAARTALSGDALARFGAYLETHGIIDQKRIDALALLDGLDDFIARTPRPVMPEPLANTRSLQNLWLLIGINPPQLDAAVLSHESRILKLGRLLVGRQYHLVSQLAAVMNHYWNEVKAEAPAPYEPVPWLDTRWFEHTPQLLAMLSAALADCPQYRQTHEIPRTVRYLAFEVGFPLDYFDLDLDLSIPAADGEPLSTNSVKNFSRLFYLLGLFVDAQTKRNPVCRDVAPQPRVVDLRMASYTIRYPAEEAQRELLASWKLEDLRDAAFHIERNGLLLNENNLGLYTKFSDGEVNWYRLAVLAAGLWPQLCSLERADVRAAFAAELAADLRKTHPGKRVYDLSRAYLPPDLLTAESILDYIATQIGHGRSP